MRSNAILLSTFAESEAFQRLNDDGRSPKEYPSSARSPEQTGRGRIRSNDPSARMNMDFHKVPDGIHSGCFLQQTHGGRALDANNFPRKSSISMFKQIDNDKWACFSYLDAPQAIC